MQILIVIIFVDSWLVTRINAFVNRLTLMVETTDLRAADVAQERGVELAEVGEYGAKNPLHSGAYVTERKSSFLEALEHIQYTV